MSRDEIEGRLDALYQKAPRYYASEGSDYMTGFLDMRAVVEDLRLLTTVDRKDFTQLQQMVRAELRRIFS